MNRIVLEKRTKKFHIDIIKLYRNFPKNASAYEITKQIIRSAGSVGANYRATKRAKSKADFIYKIEIVLEEVDETLYWLEIIMASELLLNDELHKLIKEAGELTAIFAAADKTAKKNS